jgi:hypothetical protein
MRLDFPVLFRIVGDPANDYTTIILVTTTIAEFLDHVNRQFNRSDLRFAFLGPEPLPSAETVSRRYTEGQVIELYARIPSGASIRACPAFPVFPTFVPLTSAQLSNIFQE